MTTRTPGAGLYVHVPYCRHRCHFCAFRITTHLDTVDLWAEAVVREIDRRAPGFADVFETVYFGGGTPSTVPTDTLLLVLERIRERLSVADDAEISIEANPGNLDRDGMGRLRRAGFNRLSLGVQSFSDEDLRFLTRDHTAEEGVRSILDARAAGFDNLTTDLLYGLPGRPRERLLRDLDRVAELAPDHVSAYQLTIEPGTPFSARRRRGNLSPLGAEAEAEVYRLVRDHLAGAGYAQYEVSSFARAPEFESRHNRKYWEGAPYLGVGPAAHSFRDPVRTENHPRVETWARAVLAGEEPFAAREELDEAARRLERLFLGLRTTRGVAIADFPGLVEERAELIRSLAEEGKVELAGDVLRLTPEGLAVADGIAVELSR